MPPDDITGQPWSHLRQRLIDQFHVTAAIMVQSSIRVKQRKQDVIAFVNTVTQFIHRGSYAHISSRS